MAWTNLPTNYTDATFEGMRKYIPIMNTDGTTSFQDVTVYENKENSFFGANDANRMNEGINTLMNTAARMSLSSVTLTASNWSNKGDYYTQSVSIMGVEATERIDIQPDADVLLQLVEDGVSALYIENDGGVLTAYSVGGVPSATITVQVTRINIPSVV